jgi:D-methionine transport system permease protein
MSELPGLLWTSTLETLHMVGLSAAISALGGLVLGILLAVTARGRILESPVLHRVLSTVTNVGRSIPFIILLVAIVPFTRVLVGTSIGTGAAIVPLVVGAIPYAGRLVESALLEVDRGVIDAVITMGATPLQVIWKCYLPEAVPALFRALTILSITLTSYSAMAGAIGGGGLGDLAIRYGYQRFRPEVMMGTVVVLVVLVQLMQVSGDLLAKRFDRR